MNLPRICLSGDGQGELAAAIRERLKGAEWIHDANNLRSCEPNPQSADIAICTTGRMRIRDAATVSYKDVALDMESNYFLPRAFTERHIAAMRKWGVRGLIIHIGSNAPWYGNVGAEEYAAGKTALRKYLELRAKDVKTSGIRISLPGFAGISTRNFWNKAVEYAPAALAAPIVAGNRTPLTPDEVAQVIVAIIMLPPNVCLRDGLFTSVDYQ